MEQIPFRNSCHCDNEISEVKAVLKEERDDERKEYFKILESNHLSRFEHTKEEIEKFTHFSEHVTPWVSPFEEYELYALDERAKGVYKSLNERAKLEYEQKRLKCNLCKDQKDQDELYQ